VCNFLKADGQSYSDSGVIDGFFKHFFGMIGSSQPEDHMSPAYEKELRRYHSRSCSVHNQSLLNSFELEELERAMGPLPCNKSPSHDGLLNEHLSKWWWFYKTNVVVTFQLGFTKCSGCRWMAN